MFNRTSSPALLLNRRRGTQERNFIRYRSKRANLVIVF